MTTNEERGAPFPWKTPRPETQPTISMNLVPNAPFVNEPPAESPWDSLIPQLGRFFSIGFCWLGVGANVVPILPGDKSPAVSGWGKGGDGPCLHSVDSPKLAPAQLGEWRQQFCHYNVAVFPASINAMVVDVDDTSRLPEVLEACGPTNFRTFSGRAGGGVHLWYVGATNSRNKICRGVDLKSTGGYVLAPGSVHALTGRDYEASPALLQGLAEGNLDLPTPRDGWRKRLEALDQRLRNPGRMDLQQLAGRFQNNPEKRPLADALKKLDKGEAFAEPGERENVIWKLCSTMHRAWPDATVESILRLFTASAEAMEAEHDVGIPILEQVETKWARLTRDREEHEAEETDRRRTRRAEAWAWVGERRDFAVEIGELPVVVHAGKTFFARVHDRWAGPWTRDDFSAAALDSLSALYEDGGWAELRTLLKTHGTRAAEIRQSLVARETNYNPDTGVLTVAIAPIRQDLEPEHSDAVEIMIKEIAGPYAAELRHWLAGLVRNDHPCRALVLSGRRELGKSLLLNGIGRLWQHGSAKLRDVVGKRFNGAALLSGLAVADDDTSPAESGEAMAAHLRESVSDRTLRIERKYHEVAHLEGSLRFAVATNDADAFIRGAVNYKLNDASLEAFGDRLLHIPVPDTAAEWWKRCGATPAELVEGDAIAKHVLWLAEQEEHREAWEDERFWVGPGDEDLARHAVLSSGLRGDVLLRIHEGLAGPESQRSSWLRVEDDRVMVAVGPMLVAWLDSPPRANNRTVGEACKALAGRSKCEQPIDDKKGARWLAIDRDLVEWFVSRCGL